MIDKWFPLMSVFLLLLFYAFVGELTRLSEDDTYEDSFLILENNYS